MAGSSVLAEVTVDRTAIADDPSATADMETLSHLLALLAPPASDDRGSDPGPRLRADLLRRRVERAAASLAAAASRKSPSR